MGMHDFLVSNSDLGCLQRDSLNYVQDLPSRLALTTKKLGRFTHRLGSVPLQRDSSVASAATLPAAVPLPALPQNDTCY